MMKRLTLLLGVAVVFLATACVSIVGGEGGGISPSQFVFESYVPPDAIEPGGWKAARVIINLVRKSDEDGLHFVPCEVQVEVPESNLRGAVSDEYAQEQSAKAADAAVEHVLPRGLMSEEMCERLRNTMREILKSPIPGVRVRKFVDMKGATKKGR
jgi:hypothetical protein